MNKLIYVISFMLIGMSVSCEKQDWFSPEDVDAMKAQHQAQLNELTFANNELTTSAADLTTQVATLTTTVETLQAEVTSLTTSNTTLTDANATLIAENATVQALNDDVASLTAQVDSLTTNIATLDAQIVTLNTTITNSGATNTDLTNQITTLTANVTTLTAQVTTLEAAADVLEADILALKNFKSIRDKLDVMVAATIADTNLNKAIDSLSIGLTTTSITPSVLDGLITAEANWLFNNAVTSGTTSMTTAATNFYNTSTDTNVVNYKSLVTELTAAWNAAKESTLILWFIEFVKEFENL
jgi:prefoldin subunit 5|tara:strand:- start:114 stop:1013 length:900 start_codon:yes stop_codon:yes gene_type:complete